LAACCFETGRIHFMLAHSHSEGIFGELL
jgi:hypothetical protein